MVYIAALVYKNSIWRVKITIGIFFVSIVFQLLVMVTNRSMRNLSLYLGLNFNFVLA